MEINVTIISVVVVLFLFIPGFFFKRFYYSGQFTKQFHSGTFAEKFITSLFWGMIVQCIAIVAIGKFTELEYNDIRGKLNEFYGELKKENLPACSGSSFNNFVGFLVFTSLLASLMGFFCHKLVRLTKLDIYLPALRFSNNWNYYFKGELTQLRDKKKKGKVISTIIDVLVRQENGEKEKSVLYRGFLADYTISHTNGELDNIILSNASRWTKTSNPAGFKPIPGDNLIILHSNVLNLNLTYNTRSRTIFDRLTTWILLICLGALPVVIVMTIIKFINLSWWRISLLLLTNLFIWLLLTIAIFGPIIEISNSKKKNEPIGKKWKTIIAATLLAIIIAFSMYICSRYLLI